MPLIEVQNLSILAELQFARYDRTLAEAMPSTVLADWRSTRIPCSVVANTSAKSSS